MHNNTNGYVDYEIKCCGYGKTIASNRIKRNVRFVAKFKKESGDINGKISLLQKKQL